MSNKEMFDSCVRSSGDQAGIFEYDGETGYFYLYELELNESQKVISAIRVFIGQPDFSENDLSIRWNATENTVGLFIRGKLWAAFDSTTGAKYGGDYHSDGQTVVPQAIQRMFTM